MIMGCLLAVLVLHASRLMVATTRVEPQRSRVSLVPPCTTGRSRVSSCQVFPLSARSSGPTPISWRFASSRGCDIPRASPVMPSSLGDAARAPGTRETR